MLGYVRVCIAICCVWEPSLAGQWALAPVGGFLFWVCLKFYSLDSVLPEKKFSLVKYAGCQVPAGRGNPP